MKSLVLSTSYLVNQELIGSEEYKLEVVVALETKTSTRCQADVTNKFVGVSNKLR